MSMHTPVSRPIGRPETKFKDVQWDKVLGRITALEQSISDITKELEDEDVSGEEFEEMTNKRLRGLEAAVESLKIQQTKEDDDDGDSDPEATDNGN